jgi:hypothetical protein
MTRWTVVDRQGREIYLTQERWDHIVSKHAELKGRRNDILTTIRLGRRKQSQHDPATYIYYRRVHDLPGPYNTILVFVAFRYTFLSDTNEQVPNNFVTTAWGDVAAA